MKSQIGLITIWTDDIDKMKAFYHHALGFKIKSDLAHYIELENEGARFALCKRSVMHRFSDAYLQNAKGQGSRVRARFPMQ